MKKIGVPGLTYIASLGNPSANTIRWSPTDANSILVSSFTFGIEDTKVYLLDVLTGKKEVLVDIKRGDIEADAWSSDGSKISLAIDANPEEFPGGGLWTLNLENQTKERVLGGYGAALWLPGKDEMIVITGDDIFNKVPGLIVFYLMNPRIKEYKEIYSVDALALTGYSLSPNGKSLAFSLEFDYTLDNLYILDIETGSVNQTTNDNVSSYPVWSPQGDLIVYTKSTLKGDKSISTLRIMSSDASCDIEIPNISHAYSPTWSPDGRKIAFIGLDGIYVLDTNIVFGRDIYKSLCP